MGGGTEGNSVKRFPTFKTGTTSAHGDEQLEHSRVGGTGEMSPEVIAECQS